MQPSIQPRRFAGDGKHLWKWKAFKFYFISPRGRWGLQDRMLPARPTGCRGPHACPTLQAATCSPRAGASKPSPGIRKYIGPTTRLTRVFLDLRAPAPLHKQPCHVPALSSVPVHACGRAPRHGSHRSALSMDHTVQVGDRNAPQHPQLRSRGGCHRPAARDHGILLLKRKQAAASPRLHVAQQPVHRATTARIPLTPSSGNSPAVNTPPVTFPKR